MKIIPIAMTSVDWDRYVRETMSMLGRSPTRSLDAHGFSVGDVFSFLASLAEFQHKGSHPLELVRQANRLLKAVSISFLCDVEVGVRELIRQESDLFIIAPEDSLSSIFILSGNLYELREAIVECSNDKKAFELRFFMNHLYLLLTKVGLGDIFKVYKRYTNPDETFSLI